MTIMKAPKAAFAEGDIEKIKKDFSDAGVRLVVVLYGNNAPKSPEFQVVANEV